MPAIVEICRYVSVVEEHLTENLIKTHGVQSCPLEHGIQVKVLIGCRKGETVKEFWSTIMEDRQNIVAINYSVPVHIFISEIPWKKLRVSKISAMDHPLNDLLFILELPGSGIAPYKIIPAIG